MAVAMSACWPAGRRSGREWAILAAGVVGGLVLSVPATAAYNVLGVAMLLAVLARAQGGLVRRAMLMAAFAATALGVFRLACTTIAVVWQAADGLGAAMGAVAAAVSGKPLRIGASLGGVDFLVLMLAFWGVWLAKTAPPRRLRAVCSLAAILAGQARLSGVDLARDRPGSRLAGPQDARAGLLCPAAVVPQRRPAVAPALESPYRGRPDPSGDRGLHVPLGHMESGKPKTKDQRPKTKDQRPHATSRVRA